MTRPTETPERRILHLAVATILDASSVPAGLDQLLEAIDPDLASFTTWRALTTLDRFLPTGSAWSIRVRSLQRRSFYAHTIALDAASQISDHLARAGIHHAVYGDLALALRHRQTGDRPVHAVSITIAETADPRSIEEAIASVPRVSIRLVDRHRLLGSIGSIDLRMEKGWLLCPGYRRVPLTDQVIGQRATSSSEEQALPMLTDAAELLRLLAADAAGPTADDWLLDAAILDAGDVERLAHERGQTAFVARRWEQARSFGLLDDVPSPQRHRTAADRLRLAATSRRTLIRTPARVMVGLLGEHPRHR